MDLSRCKKAMNLSVTNNIVVLYLVKPIFVCTMVQSVVSPVGINNDITVRVSVSHSLLRKSVVSIDVVNVARDLKVAIYHLWQFRSICTFRVLREHKEDVIILVEHSTEICSTDSPSRWRLPEVGVVV